MPNMSAKTQPAAQIFSTYTSSVQILKAEYFQVKKQLRVKYSQRQFLDKWAEVDEVKQLLQAIANAGAR
jgi:hypothetical protein